MLNDLERYFIKKEREYLNRIQHLENQLKKASAPIKISVSKPRKRKLTRSINLKVGKYEVFKLGENGFNYIGVINITQHCEFKEVSGL